MRHAFLLVVTFAALSGCATFSQDGGFTPVADSARRHLNHEVVWSRNAEEQAKVAAQTAALLQRPLSAEEAVQVALLNNRALQAAFEELGVSESDLVQAGRLPNPRFDLRHASGAGQYDIEETLSFNVVALLTMPYARAAARQSFAEVQSATVLQIAQLAQETREAFYSALAARDSLDTVQRVRAAAETGAKLAQKMSAAGNWSRIDRSREQIFHAEALDTFVQTQLAEKAARGKLLALMGVDTGSAAPTLQLTQALPDLPAQIESLPDIEAAVLQNRLDLQLMRQQIDELRQRLKLTRGTRFINVLDAGATRVRQGSRDEPFERGFTITLEVPLFDSGDARVRKSEAIYARAVDRFTQAAIDARSQIRIAYAGYGAAFDIARQQRDDVLPLRKAVAQENLLRYYASQISIFDVLSDVREQAFATEGYVERLRDFWIAKSRLDGALLGSSAISARN